MLNRWSIAWRIILLVVLGAGCILGAVIGSSYIIARQYLKDELQAKAENLADATANDIEIKEQAVEKAAEGIALNFKIHRDISSLKEEMVPLLKIVLASNDQIVGAAVILTSKASSNRLPPAPYVFRRQGRLEVKDLSDFTSFTSSEWYRKVLHQQKTIWSEPYVSKGLDLVTCALPVFSPEAPKQLIGVVSCDLDLEWLRKKVHDLKLDNAGYAFLISHLGTYIAHPKKEYILHKKTVFDVARENNSQQLMRISKEMVAKIDGREEIKSTYTGKASWLVYRHIPSANWSLAVILGLDKMQENVLRLSQSEGLLILAGFVILLLMALIIAYSIVKPIRQLEEATRTLATGQLDTPLPAFKGADEVAHLAASFDQMRSDLKKYLENLKETTAAKERIESEMKIAHDIQMSLVPKTFPSHDHYDLHALLEPARDVGGDFYDFFMIDDDHLALVIGDVSDKGVPAALFMAVTRTYIKLLATAVREPAILMRRLNDEITRDNDTGMFVTLFFAILHLPSGLCRYASGGHNPPLLRRADGEVEIFPMVKGFVIGGLDGMSYTEGTVQLQRGDAIFLYTDGVTEAFNADGQLFGMEQSMDVLASLSDRTAQEITQGMKTAVAVFVAGNPPSDDITMLTVRWTLGGDSPL